jgi:hypothetical protein
MLENKIFLTTFEAKVDDELIVFSGQRIIAVDKQEAIFIRDNYLPYLKIIGELVCDVNENKFRYEN